MFVCVCVCDLYTYVRSSVDTGISAEAKAGLFAALASTDSEHITYQVRRALQ